MQSEEQSSGRDFQPLGRDGDTYQRPEFSPLGSFRQRTRAISGENWEPTLLWN